MIRASVHVHSHMTTHMIRILWTSSNSYHKVLGLQEGLGKNSLKDVNYIHACTLGIQGKGVKLNSQHVCTLGIQGKGVKLNSQHVCTLGIQGKGVKLNSQHVCTMGIQGQGVKLNSQHVCTLGIQGKGVKLNSHSCLCTRIITLLQELQATSRLHHCSSLTILGGLKQGKYKQN